MKAFFTILFLFTLLFAAIFANYAYVNNLATTLAEDLERLPFPNEAATTKEAERIRDAWQDNKRFVQISINHTEIEFISNAATELCVFAQQKNIAEFERARHILINALEELRFSEMLSLINIL